MKRRQNLSVFEYIVNYKMQTANDKEFVHTNNRKSSMNDKI